MFLGQKNETFSGFVTRVVFHWSPQCTITTDQPQSLPKLVWPLGALEVGHLISCCLWSCFNSCESLRCHRSSFTPPASLSGVRHAVAMDARQFVKLLQLGLSDV